MKENRQKHIAYLLKKNGVVNINDLIKEFDVSVQSIRRDFNQLEQEGILIKTYGGAVLANAHLHTELGAWQTREETCRFEKQLLAQYVATLIPDNSLVAIDSGTTLYECTKCFSQKKGLTIITNDIPIAQEVNRHTHNQVFFLGGMLNATGSSNGYLAKEILSNFASIDICVMSAECLTIEDGFTTVSSEMNELKKLFMSRSLKKIAVLDHTKFGKRALFRTGHCAEVDMLVTDSLAPMEVVEQIEQLGVQVIVVPVDE